MSDGLIPAQAVVEEALAAARPGSDGCVVIVEETSEVDVRFANNATTTNGRRRDRRVTVVCLREVEGGISTGVASRGGDADVADLVRAAEHDADSSPAADDAAELLGPGIIGLGPSAARFERPPEETDLSVLSGVLSGLSSAFTDARADQYVLAGFAEHRRATEYLGTSTGVRLAHCQPDGALQLVARTPDGSASTWAGAGTADFTDVSIAEMEARLRDRLGWFDTRLERGAGRYEVVLPPEAVADLMIALAFETSGRNAEDAQTVFPPPGGGTRLGERLSPLAFDLRADPEEPGLETAPFLTAGSSSTDSSVFDNGMPLRRTDWIKDGRLHRLRYHRAGAARSGVEPAGFIASLVLELPGSNSTVEEMVSRTERGLLLTCLWYIREVDPATMLLTGLTRDGVYVIEDGRVVGATNNFRFNESPVDLLSRATEVGTSVRALGREYGEYLNRTKMPALRVPDFNMSSVSQAS
jgi:predicted Zn-dependent protease